jgi:hypothetical protein
MAPHCDKSAEKTSHRHDESNKNTQDTLLHVYP